MHKISEHVHKHLEELLFRNCAVTSTRGALISQLAATYVTYRNGAQEGNGGENHPGARRRAYSRKVALNHTGGGTPSRPRPGDFQLSYACYVDMRNAHPRLRRRVTYASGEMEHAAGER